MGAEATGGRLKELGVEAEGGGGRESWGKEGRPSQLGAEQPRWEAEPVGSQFKIGGGPASWEEGKTTLHIVYRGMATTNNTHKVLCTIIWF
jgi:hypothetical protein